MREVFIFIKRPKLERIKWIAATDALESTVNTDKAVRIPLNGHDPCKARHAIRRALNRRGLCFRGFQENGNLVGWAEEMPDEYLQR
jgi:hypothetical protein